MRKGSTRCAPRAGLGPALEVLAGRAPLVVEPSADLPGGSQRPVETAHVLTVSRRSPTSSSARTQTQPRYRSNSSDGQLLVEIADDGAGGGPIQRGSGLRGLRDRSGTLAGKLSVESPPDTAPRRVALPVPAAYFATITPTGSSWRPLLGGLEGSSGLAERLGGTARLSWRRRASCSVEAVAREGGEEIDARGDELFSVFSGPNAATAAALQVQRSFAARAWPRKEPVHVRMASTSVRPNERGAVWSASTSTGFAICQAGHSGQILLSQK